MFIDIWNEAKQRGNAEELLKLLLENKETCKNANTLCLVEVFCPECPWGGFMVRSSRS